MMRTTQFTKRHLMQLQLKLDNLKELHKVNKPIGEPPLKLTREFIKLRLD